MPKADLTKRINRGLSGGTTLVSGGGATGVGGSVGNAHTVDFLHASPTPEPGKLFPLDGTSKFLDSVLPATIVRTSRQVISGAGLTGGGDLSADRTLAVGAGTLITVNANDVALSVGSAQYQFPMTGATPFTPAWTLLSTLAGAGLTWGSGVFDIATADTSMTINASSIQVALAATSGLAISSGLMLADGVAGDGLTIASKVLALDLSSASGLQLTGSSPAKTLEMGTPSTITASTTNGVSAATHVHTVTSTADGATSHSTLLKSGTSGELQLDYATLLSYLRTPLVDTASGNLTLSPAADLMLDPDSHLVKLPTPVSIQADNFASQTTGWRVTYEGAGDFRYLFADEMHVKSFIADLEQALAGGQIICKSVSTVAVAYTLPAAGAASTVWIKDLPSAENMAVFVSGDLIRFRVFSRAAGELVVADAWGVVTAYADQANKQQTWTFTRSAGGLAGTASGVIPVDAIVLDYGVTGNGYIEANAIDGLRADNSPYTQIVSWNTHPLTTLTVRTRLGNLHGLFSVDNEYGLFAGSGITSAHRYIRISNTEAAFHNMPLVLYDGASEAIKLNVTGTLGTDDAMPTFSLGVPLPTAPLVGDGIWMGKHAPTDYEFRVGTVSAGALVKGMHWDGASLDIRGNLIVGPGHGFVLESPSMVCAYDGPRPYATDYQVDLTGHLGQKGTPVGGVIGRPGVFGKALQTAPAVTNYYHNPSFEHATYDTGWSKTGSNPPTTAAETDTANVAIGVKSAKVTFAGSNSFFAQDFIANKAALNGVAITISAWVKTSNAGIILSLYANYATISPATSSAHPGDGAWHKLSFTTTPAFDVGGTTTALLCGIWGNVNGYVAYCDGFQLEIHDYATPYCDGSLGSGHAWAGTAHNSDSTRTVGYVTYPIGDVIKNARKGSVGCWIYCEGQAAGGAQTIWEAGTGTELAAWVYASATLLRLYVNTVTADASITPRAWYHVAFTWDCDNDRMYSYVNGIPGVRGHPTATAPTLQTTLFGVGFSPHYSTTFNGYICDFFVTEAVLSADQVKQMYSSALPLVATRNPMSLLLTGAGKGKVEGSAGGIFAQDTAGKPTWALLNEATTVNGESLGAGDVLLGDNTASKANLLWDQSAGKLLFRGGTTMQVEIGTDGKLWWAGGKGTLNATGMQIKSLDSWATANSIQFIRDSGGALIGYMSGLYDGSANDSVGIGTSRNSGLTFYINLFAATASSIGNILLHAHSCELNVRDDATLLAVTISQNTLIGTVTDGMTAGGSVAIAQDLAHRGTKVGFFNTTPIVKRVHIADATDAATVITRANAIIAALEAYGLLALS